VTNVASLVLADRVHGSIYKDPALFHVEMDRIFHQGWVYLGHASEIPEPGDFRTAMIGRQPVIFVRGDDGEVRVLMNRCTHRGSLLCPNERGNSKRFTCAYHAWSFRNTGALAAIPFRERYGLEFDKQDHDLRPAPRIATYREFVFVSLASEGQEFDDYLTPGARRELDLVTDMSPEGKLLVNVGVHKYQFQGNWKLQAENNIDAYHFGFVHASFVDIQRKRSGYNIAAVASGDSKARIRDLGGGHVAWDYRPINRGLAKKAMADDPMFPEWRRDWHKQLIAAHGEEKAHALILGNPSHAYIFPNLALIGSQIRVMQPTAVDHTKMFVYPHVLAGVPNEVNVQRIRAHEAFYGPAGGGATDDFEIFSRIDRGLEAQVDPWILISRGLGMEEVDEDGFQSGQVTDELGSRTILHHWRGLMAGPYS
jgi:phenylpropionate dioxygenase-like ring-hydroxylating dioxygenase large terminal subunit